MVSNQSGLWPPVAALFFVIVIMNWQTVLAQGASSDDKINSRTVLFTPVTEGPLVNDVMATPGVCIVDYNGDNLPDIYQVNTSQNEEGVANALLRNIGGAIFEEISGIPIVEDLAFGYAASWADFEGDGDLDLAVANWMGQPSKLYINGGQGSFEATWNGPLSQGVHGSTSVSWVDFDLDNDLDLFIANCYGDGSTGEAPHPNFLFRNDDGTLNLITSDTIVTHARHTYGASWGDYDNDGDPDLVNTNNDPSESADLFQNNGDGSFTLLPTSVLGPESHPGACGWIDYDNDLDFDLHLVNQMASQSVLYQNDGAGTLTQIFGHGLGDVNGIVSGGFWEDYDNDGDQDIIMWFRPVEATAPVRCYGFLYDNIGDGAFDRLSNALFEFDKYCVISAVPGDIDRDGDIDFLLGRFDPEWQSRPEYASDILYLNNGNDNHWITVKPIGSISNRSAVGAKVRIKATINGQPVWQLRELTTMTGLRGQPPLEAHFGLSDAFIIDSIKIEWPGGQITDILTNVAVNQFLTITESICGEVNGDGQVNILDIVFLINYKYKNGPAPEPLYPADVDSNSQINILDIVYLINYRYKSGPKPNCP